MMLINKNEVAIIGSWNFDGKEIIADENCKRIDYLVQGYLTKISSNDEGWTTLYEDPNDGRLWELSYPKSEMHGGGPPKLAYLSRDQATTKYSLGS